MNPESSRQEPAKRRALGKGLESLLSGRAAGKPSSTTVPEDRTVSSHAPAALNPGGKPLDIPLDQIEPNPYQTRKQVDELKIEELARSIQAVGVIQPILVRTLPDGRFQLIAGERRWKASVIARKQTIPAVVCQASDQNALEMTIVENLQRADLNPMEQAYAFDRLNREFRMTQEQIAHRTGKDRASVGNFMRLLRLPPEVQKQVESGELTFGHAKILLTLDSRDDISKAAAKVLSLSLSVRHTEAYVQSLLNPGLQLGEQKTKVKEPLDPNVREARDLLQRQLGLRVKIVDRKGKGRVIIEYSGLEDFDALMTALGANS